ncbi:MAG: glycosyltransferase family 4 protein [bacterium]
MKIFFVTLQFPRDDSMGGAEIQCLLLAQYLARRGHQTVYLGLKEKTSVNMINSIPLMAGNNSMFRALIKFYQLIKKEQPDICYVRSFNYLFPLFLICRLNKVKVAYNTCHINDCSWVSHDDTGWKAKVLHFLSFQALRMVKVITINREHAKILERKLGVEAETIHNSMADNYQPVAKQQQVVWVNNIKPRKNPEMFLKLADEFKTGNWQFLMIGGLQDEKYLPAIKAAENNNPNFKYLGAQPVAAVDRILAQASIMVNTCESEGFGNNFIQAWLAQCPTITLKFDPEDIIKNRQLGFHSGGLEQMANDLAKLMADEKLIMEMGQRARVYALAEHRLEKNGLKYEACFQNLALGQ